MNEKLFGSTNPVAEAETAIYAVTPRVSNKSSVVSVQSVGYVAEGGLTALVGALCGTSVGLFGGGAVFKLDPKSLALTAVIRLPGARGGQPGASLVSLGNVFCGTTNIGGQASRGMIFDFVP